MSGENMLLYLRGERTIDYLRRQRLEFVQACIDGRRHLLDGKDLDLLELVHRNSDLLKPQFSKLSGRTGVPISTLSDRWKRLLKKKVRIVLRVQPIEGGEGLDGLSSPSEACSRRAYRKPSPSSSEGRRAPALSIFTF